MTNQQAVLDRIRDLEAAVFILETKLAVREYEAQIDDLQGALFQGQRKTLAELLASTPVDETAKCEQESAVTWDASAPLVLDCPRCGHCCQQREWVGLTHDEVDSCELPDCPTVFEFAQFIEAKLKEKNA